MDALDKGVTEMVTPGGKQQLPIINESGLYSLIFSSKLEGAQRFKRWVTSEVLPSIPVFRSIVSHARHQPEQYPRYVILTEQIKRSELP